MNRLYMSVFRYRPSSHANPVSVLHGQKPRRISSRNAREERAAHLRPSRPSPADPESTSGCVLYFYIYMYSGALTRSRTSSIPSASAEARQKLLPDIPEKNETAPSTSCFDCSPSSARPPTSIYGRLAKIYHPPMHARTHFPSAAAVSPHTCHRKSHHRLATKSAIGPRHT